MRSRFWFDGECAIAFGLMEVRSRLVWWELRSRLVLVWIAIAFWSCCKERDRVWFLWKCDMPLALSSRNFAGGYIPQQDFAAYRVWFVGICDRIWVFGELRSRFGFCGMCDRIWVFGDVRSRLVW
jgi:hypothetical protein